MSVQLFNLRHMLAIYKEVRLGKAVDNIPEEFAEVMIYRNQPSVMQ